MLWPITSNPNPKVLKIEKWKINQKENKMRNENKEKISLPSSILTAQIYKSTVGIIQWFDWKTLFICQA